MNMIWTAFLVFFVLDFAWKIRTQQRIAALEKRLGVRS